MAGPSARRRHPVAERTDAPAPPAPPGAPRPGAIRRVQRPVVSASAGASLARASLDARAAHAASSVGRQAEARRRSAVSAVDRLLDAVEEINLDGRGARKDALLPGRVRRLEPVVGGAIPAEVRAARTAHALHAALLDWQDELLNAAVPHRAAMRGLDDGWSFDLWPADLGGDGRVGQVRPAQAG